MKIILLLLLCFTIKVFAEPIELVTGGGPGSSSDIFARKIVEVIEKNSDLNIIVIPKVGASFNIAFQYVHYTKKPTIFISNKLIVTNKNNTVGYPDGLLDMVKPIVYVGDSNTILITSIRSGIKTYRELEDLSKVRQIKIGYGGINTNSEDVALRLCSVMDSLCVPYKNASSGIIDLNSNTIDAYPIASFGSKSLLSSGGYIPLKTFSMNSWNILFSKNLSLVDEKIIINIINNQSEEFFKSLGITRRLKPPTDILLDAQKGN